MTDYLGFFSALWISRLEGYTSFKYMNKEGNCTRADWVHLNSCSHTLPTYECWHRPCSLVRLLCLSPSHLPHRPIRSHKHTRTHRWLCVCEPVYSCLIKSFSLANESPYTLHTDWGVRSSILMNRRSVPANGGTRGNLFILTGCWSAALWSPFVILLSYYVCCWQSGFDIFCDKALVAFKT